MQYLSGRVQLHCCHDWHKYSVLAGLMPVKLVFLSSAGKVRDLYKAMAVVLSLPPSQAHKLLLLAEYASNQTLAMHSQGSEPLNMVQITNGPGYYSSSKPLLLAYHYASPDQGPSSGKQLLIYNRCLHLLFCSAYCCFFLAICLLSLDFALCPVPALEPFACCQMPHAQMAIL